MDIFQQILEWPVIIQGALGSALFWVILFFGQKSTIFLSSKISEDKDVATYFCLTAKSAPSHEQKTRGFLCCIYGAIHYLIKALIIIVVSLFVLPINNVVPMVGFPISLYFLFRSLSYVQHFTSLGSHQESLNQLIEIGDKYSD